jgi:hypothetical protein
MNEFAAGGTGCTRKIAAFEERNREPAPCRIPGDARAVDAPPDDREIVDGFGAHPMPTGRFASKKLMMMPLRSRKRQAK